MKKHLMSQLSKMLFSITYLLKVSVKVQKLLK